MGKLEETGELRETEVTGELGETEVTGARCSHYVLLTLPQAPEASPSPSALSFKK